MSVNGGIKALGQCQGIGPGLLLNTEDHRALSFVTTGTTSCCRSNFHFSQIAHQHGYALALGDDSGSNIFQRLHPATGMDQKLLLVLDQKSAAGALVGTTHGIDDLLQGEAIGGHPFRLHLHLILLGQAAGRDDLGNSRYCQQASAQGPFGGGLERHLIMAFGDEGDEHDLAHYRGHRCQHRRRNVLWQLGGRHLELLIDDLPCPVDVGFPVELDDDDRQSDAGVGSYPAHASRTVHGGLNWEGDQALDLNGGQAVYLGDDSHLRCSQIGEYIDGCVQCLPTAPGQQTQGNYQHHDALL